MKKIILMCCYTIFCWNLILTRPDALSVRYVRWPTHTTHKIYISFGHSFIYLCVYFTKWKSVLWYTYIWAIVWIWSFMILWYIQHYLVCQPILSNYIDTNRIKRNSILRSYFSIWHNGIFSCFLGLLPNRLIVLSN